MCDICGDVLTLLQIQETRTQENVGQHLTKEEIFAVASYASAWQSRQCMCVFKDPKNFERLNNLVQIVLNQAISLIPSLPEDFMQEQQEKHEKDDKRTNTVGTNKLTESKVLQDVDTLKSKNANNTETKQKTKDSETLDDGLTKSSNSDTTPSVENESEKITEDTVRDNSTVENIVDTDKDKADVEENVQTDHWSIEEKDKLLLFVSKLYLVNFPLYMAYKHTMHTSIEELSQQETSALNSYCDLTFQDAEIPVYLLRNVCFFCDSNGIQALKTCFDNGTPDSLPIPLLHTLVNVIANLRLWMNVPTVVQYITPLKSPIVKYMCKLSDKDLRLAGNRNLTDLLWTALREPMETNMYFDKEGLELAFKYFTCTTLTLRLTGIAQINNHINNYNEVVNSENVVEPENVGCQLADWLTQNKIIQHIFGPNLHVEIIKQSQIVLNFLAIESRVTEEHIDSIWSAAQLKHCSRQVQDLLIALIKNLEINLVQYLLKLVSSIEPQTHNEQTLCLASALIKAVWSSPLPTHMVTLSQQSHQNYTALAREQEELEKGLASKHDVSSSDETGSSDDLDEGHMEIDQHNVVERESCDCSHHQTRRHHHRHVHHRHHHEGDGGSLCANSELSNISEDSLPSDMFDEEEYLHTHAQHHEMGTDSGEESEKAHALHRHMIRRARRVARQHAEDEEEDEEDEESWDEDEIDTEEELLQEQARLLRLRQRHRCGHRRGHTVETESSKEEECSDEESEMETSHENEKSDQVKVKLIKVPKTDGVQRNTQKPMPKSIAEQRRNDSQDEAKKSEVLKDVKKTPSKRDSEGIPADSKSSEPPKVQHKPETGPSRDELSDDSDTETKDVTRVKNAPITLSLGKKTVKRPGLQQRAGRKLMPKSVAERKQRALMTRLKRIKEQCAAEEEASQSEPAEQKTDAQVSKDAEIGEVKVTTVPNQEMETEVFDCRGYLDQLGTRKDRAQQEDFEDILSPEGSFNSSRGSTKSEKNMADFEGEVSDEELLSAHYKHHMQHHMASIYHSHIPTVVHEACANEVDESAGFDDVCGKGKTLLWDLVQDDKAPLLPEGLAIEAEKILCSLVCFSTDRRIRMRFIEACIKNIAYSRSVVISLRLLPKLFGSFQQYRSGLDTHAITMWAEKELGMMSHFFNNLICFKENMIERSFPGNLLYSYKEEIYVRLQFLTCVYSMLASPEDFTMSLEQVDVLWNSLVVDPESSDECLNWFLNQAKTKDHHALKLETFKHLFMEKMPTLKPETMSMVGLNLFQQLCHLARCHNASLDNPLPEDRISGMDQLWGIALRANNTDVSISAIQYINCYYIGFGGGNLNKEKEFIKRCMHSLMSASALPEDKSPGTNLMIIQRGLILLKNHLEGFKKRFSFHLRNWQLDGKAITSHQVSGHGKGSSQIRITLQPAGMPEEKATVEMSTSDMVGDLRAEVTRWWLSVQKRQKLLHQQQQEQSTSNKASTSSSMLTPLLGAMLGDGPVRMITLGQELNPEMDEKVIGELQIKDQQIIFVSTGANRSQRSHSGGMPACYLPAPDRELTPMMILLEDPYFGQLFGLLQLLSNMKCTTHPTDSQERSSLENKARILSRKVWELLMLLPTNPRILEGFQALLLAETPGSDGDISCNWQTLLDPHNPHKLMYSLQVVEFLSKIPRQRRKSMVRNGGGDSFLASTDSELSVDLNESPEEIWRRKFINKGGLSHLFNIFALGSLQIKDGDHWCEWNQECLAYLLRLVSLFAVTPTDDMAQDEVFESTNYESPRKRMRKNRTNEKIIVPLNQTILSMMKVEPVLKILTTILYDAALPSYSEFGQMQTWGRSEVVHYAMSFLVSWAYSCDDVIPALCMMDNCSDWLKRLTVDAPEPTVRCEACKGLYKLCLGRTTDGRSGYKCLLPFISHMLKFLPTVLKIKVHHEDSEYEHKEKEPLGPGCRDYFWLLSGLVENINKEDISQSYQQDNLANLDNLANHITKCIREREFYETRYSMAEDHVLIGLLQLCTVVIKLNPPFKCSQAGQDFLLELFWCLFALPSPNQRHLPKCKSQAARSATYDLIVELTKGNMENYSVFHAKVLEQHTKDVHSPYPWDHWPHEDGRSNCGYVGLTNLGATCYLATCMQHLYMIPQARQSVLQAKCSNIDLYEGTLVELQKMFAYLLESERKAYNPKSFCKVYTMDKQPLNTGEQKDMTEFFTDLISKLEEMSPDLKLQVKGLFGGILTNNVVSLDCPHVSRTLEEFYTVRCQVADMKNLYDSLDEVTVKDTLEGDNMYTCSTCQKKVRAEKRACFKKLPKILCFNTMRYTFNMLTMMKEKVNTHFSFPLRLDMSDYMEKNLMKPDKLEEGGSMDGEGEINKMEDEGYEYELIGVTVHTGTADGGHYYSFIRDRINKPEKGPDKWYLFNDAEVKPFDATQIASECFGGEMMSKTYDSMTDKFMDFSFEKTNSAYMLFYERISHQHSEKREETTETLPRFNFELSKDLADWIWQDNMHFLQDKNLFEHTYFSFMWQMCGYIPTTLPKDNPQRVSIMASQLSTSFVLETLIHAKEKPTMLQWIELLTKQFNSCQAACEWFLDHMSKDDWWPQQILIRCPNQVVRKMFQRLVTHVVTQLRPAHASLYLHPLTEATGQEIDTSKIGDRSCVTRFIKKMLSIIEHGVNSQSHTKYLSEYFDFLFEFAKQGDVESLFLIHIHAISTMVNFYMAQKTQENYVELSDDDEDEDVIPITEEKFKPVAFEKMIALISLLVESSRGDEKLLSLPEQDYTSIIGGGKGFNFLFHQIKDGINLHKTSSLIFSLCRWNDRLAMAIIQMIFSAITKLNGEQSQPFFRLLTLLTEFLGGPPGHPPFTNYILQKFWDVTEFCPQQCLDWLSSQVIRNKIAHAWVLNNLEVWVDQYLIAHSNLRVRNAASYLLVSLVPSQSFRQASRSGRSMISPQKELQMSAEALHVLHEIYEHLLRLLNAARLYADAAAHETTNLVAYFALLTVCLVSKTEKLMFTPYFLDLWQLFQPKLSEPPIAINHNKQALLVFWYQVCCDCPENVKLIVSNSNVTKNIAFNYILADHDDQDVVLHNRCMLPAYYGILRLCCQQSRQFTRLLAQHQNIQWAFKNITPYIAQYTSAVDELFRIMRLMVSRYEDSTEDELKAIAHFRQNTILLYVQNIDARSGWQTLVTALKILVETTDDRLLIVFNQGLHMFNEAFNTLHAMYHEATACHVTGELIDLLTLLIPTLKAARHQVEKRSHGVGSETKACLMSWKERMDFVRKLLALLNSYTPPEVRQVAIDTLKEMLLTYQSDSLQTIVPCLYHSHSAFQENNSPVMGGPFFPRRGQKLPSSKSSVRPPRPQFHMMLRNNQLECAKGIDEDYDEALQNFFLPYHLFVDFLCRVAVNQKNLNETVINLSAMVAYEAVPLHSLYFAKLWYEIYHSEHIDKTCINTLCNSNCFIDYVDAVLLDERQSLNNQIIYQFFCNFFPKVYKQVLNDQGSTLIDSLVASLTSYRSLLEDAETDAEILNTCHKINGDLRAMLLIFSVQPPSELTGLLNDNLHFILDVSQDYQKRRAEKFEAESEQPDVSEVVSSTENDPEETPPKKRKLDNEEQQPSSTNKNKDGEKSDINDQEHGEHNKDTNVAKTGHSSSQGQTSGKEQTSKCESSQKECSKQTEVKKDSNKAIREKPNAVDQTTKQILTLFSMVNKQKNKGESSQAAL